MAGVAGSFDELLDLVDAELPRRRRHRHPHAADRHRRGHPGRRPLRARAPGDRRRRAQPVRLAAYALALLEDGSDGRAYLLKDRVADADDLVAAVRAVAAGGSVIDSKVVEELVGATIAQCRVADRAADAREREILGEMAQGKSNAAIAATLILSDGRSRSTSTRSSPSSTSAEERDINRRVKAVLVYLAAAGS